MLQSEMKFFISSFPFICYVIKKKVFISVKKKGYSFGIYVDFHLIIETLLDLDFKKLKNVKKIGCNFHLCT